MDPDRDQRDEEYSPSQKIPVGVQPERAMHRLFGFFKLGMLLTPKSVLLRILDILSKDRRGIRLDSFWHHVSVCRHKKDYGKQGFSQQCTLPEYGILRTIRPPFEANRGEVPKRLKGGDC